MKAIKFIMLSVFLLIIVLMLGEFTNTRLESRQSSEFSTVYLTRCGKAGFTEAMTNMPEMGGAVFFTNDSTDSNLITRYKIFYAGISEDMIRSRLGLYSMHYDSVIVGDCTYELHHLSDLTADDAYDDPVLFCDEQAARSLREYLGGIAGDVSVQSPTKDARYEIAFEIAWIFIIVMTLAVTVYDIFSQYKTAAVTLVLGNKLRGLVGRNILIDAAGITGAFFGVSLALSFVTAVNMNLRTIVLHWLILLVLNSLAYLIFYKTDLFRALRDGEPAARLLSFNYVMKAFAALGVMTAAVYCVTLLSELGSDLKVYDEMEKLKGYSYISVQSNILPDFDDEQAMYDFRNLNQKVYELREQLVSGRKSIVSSAQQLQVGREDGISLAVIGRGGFDLMRLGIPDISDSDREQSLLLIPNRASQEDRDAARSELEWLSEDSDEPIKLDISERRYKSGSLLVLDNKDIQKFASLDSPIIIYTPNDKAAEQLNRASGHIVKISAEEFETFAKANADPDISFERTDVFGNFLHYKGSAQTFSLILIISLICAIVFELTLLISILTLEYKVNAKEICVRKILGANLLDRNKKLLGLILLTDLIGVIGAQIILGKFDMSDVGVLCFSAVILIVTELVIVFVKAQRIERVSTAKILKGGAL